MIIPRGRVMVPGFHVMKFDTNQDGLQVRGQVILDVTSRSQERTDCNLCGVVNMDLETYTFHKKTQFHLENLGDHLLCHEEEEEDARFVTPMGKCPPRTPPAPRRLREEEQVRDYPAVSLINARRELIDEEDAVSFSLSQELDDASAPTEMTGPASVPMEMTGPASVPMEMITNANAEEVKDILRRAFITDFFRNIRAQGNNGQNRSVLIQRAIETWHQHFSQYLASENKKKLEFLLHCVFKEAGKDFRFNKIDIICKSLNYVIPMNGVLLAFQRNEEFDEDVSTRKTLVSEKDFASATPSQEEETPHVDMELFIVDDDDDTIIDDEVIPEAVVADPVIPEAVVADPIVPDAVVVDPVIPDAVVADPVIPDALADRLRLSLDACEFIEQLIQLPAVIEVIDAVEPEYEEVEVLPIVTEIIVEPEYEDCEVLPTVTEVTVEPEYEDYEVLPVATEVIDKEEVKEGYHEFFYNDGVIYKGYYVNNLRSGYGECSDGEGNCYKGEWLNDVRCGECVMNWGEDGLVQYKGEYRDDNRHGQGVMTWEDGVIYEGQWQNDSEHGNGRMTYSNGDVYDGEWKEGERHGQGVFHYFNNLKKTYDGEWRKDKEHGFGMLTWSDGSVQKSTWVNSKKSNKRKSVTENKEPGWKIVKIKGDGNCTFRALAYLIYGDECYHLLLRRVCYETIFAEGKQHLLEEEEMNNWAIFGNEGGPKAIETIARLYGCQVNVIDSRKKTMSGNGPYNANDNHPVLTLVYSTGHYDAYSNGVFDFKSATFLDEHRATIGAFENRILQGKGGQIMPDQVLLSGSALQYENREYDILDVTYARSNWMTLPSKTLLDLPDGLIQHTLDRNATVFKCFDNDKGYDTKKKPPAHQYLYYYKIGNDNWICGLLATPHRVQYIKRARRN